MFRTLRPGAVGALALALVGAGVSGLIQADPARAAAGPVVSETPVGWTPDVLGDPQVDRVDAITRVGDVIVAAGKGFTQVKGDNGSTHEVSGIVAFNAKTGKIVEGFDPDFENRPVHALAPGPDGDSVYVGGKFAYVNGRKSSHLALLDLDTGDLRPDFHAGKITGRVQDIELSGDRLYVAGGFTHVNGQAHSGMVALDPRTGRPEGDFDLQFTGSRLPDLYQYSTIYSFDISPDGSRMVVAGNFAEVGGEAREQIAMIDLSGSAPEVADWYTDEYEATCNDNFDSYMRDVEFSPDGSYFVVATTGGPYLRTLCDTAARWNTNAPGPDAEPAWVASTGGDTLLSTEVTSSAVYVGGHQRWFNNPHARDRYGPGSVPRPGIAALDPENGLPLEWNPGRIPRGYGATSMLVTDRGLWVGSDTEFIGNREMRRERLAFFPYQGGTTVPAATTDQLPGNVYLPGQQAGDESGSQLFDGKPSQQSGAGVKPPAEKPGKTTPEQLSEQLDEAGKSLTGPEEAAPSVPAEPSASPQQETEQSPATAQPPQRPEEGKNAEETGPKAGTQSERKSVGEGPSPTTGDRAPEPAAAEPGLSYRHYDGTKAGKDQALAGAGLDGAAMRGAVLINGQLWHGTTTEDLLVHRSFDGNKFGKKVVPNPYSDKPFVCGKRIEDCEPGVPSPFYDQIDDITGMFFADGELYYTLDGDPDLHRVHFTPSSGVVGAKQFEVDSDGSVDWGGVRGMFLSGSDLYYATEDGDLHRATFQGGAVTGEPKTVNGQRNWAANALFLRGAPGGDPPGNEDPGNEDPPGEDPPGNEDPGNEDPPGEEDPGNEDPPGEEDPGNEDPPGENPPGNEGPPGEDPPGEEDPGNQDSDNETPGDGAPDGDQPGNGDGDADSPAPDSDRDEIDQVSMDSSSGDGSGGLPYTGMELGMLLMIALASLGVGGAFVLLGSRRLAQR